ncbi:Cna B-type domain-containing protein [uncultured Senegalimassilia sp.]|uniref:Cna B-type domain-containing protein n=1 Tax=uncultured Senegalimassilia sp. TaxID=1714350 RepID=UPI0027DACCE9|nr:Cna B-type domain-containing protein [uncultured Senegalimassilia sp.]
MKARNEEMNRHVAEHTNMKARARRMRAGARSLSSKALSIVMSAILVVGLSPLTKVSTATAGEGGSGQLPSGTYWYNGDVNFTTIDSSNGFTSSAWNAYRDTGKDGSGNALGIAGTFHLVAFNTLNSSSHIYGNILANHVYGLQDFGIKSDFVNIYGHSTLSYIQDYQSTCPRFAEQSYSDQAIVFGGNTSTFNLFAKTTNNNQVINYANTKTSGTEVQFPRTVAQDVDTATAQFIDMNAVKAETTQLSSSLAAHETAGATFDFKDQNRKTITYTQGKGCAYLTLPLSDLTSNGNPIYIKGLPLDGSAALVINVDCGNADAPIPDQVWLDTGNGQNAGLGENDADTGYVLWNFTNANGKTVTATGMVSSILAPGATINLKGNSCGTFVGENINVSGETHTRPFHGKFDNDSKPATTSVAVNKTWLDSKGNAETSVSHNGVQVQLYANGTASGDPVTLGADNSWSHQWTSLPVNDESGKAIDYTVKELTQVAGYDSAVTGSAAGGFAIVNQHKPEVEISIAKVWDDNDNIDQVRPDSVTARVMRSIEGGASEQVGGPITLNAANQWQARVSGLPTTDANGNQYTYTVVEDAVSGYKGTVEGSSSKDANGNVSYTYTLKNSHAPSVVNLSVSKVWDDAGNQDGVRPEQVSVDVLRSEGSTTTKTIVATLKLSAENNWTATLEKQPVYGKSGKYTYSISEAKVDGYTGSVETAVDESGNYAFTLTNTHAVETTQVGVTKVWDDTENADGLRPDSVEVELLADGAATGKTVTLNAENNWTFTWDNLAKKAGGKDIVYTVREAKVPEGYTSVVTGGMVKNNGAFSYTLTNKHETESTALNVQKVWDDSNNADGLRPTSVKVQLLADGKAAGQPVELSAANEWKHAWGDLPKLADGKTIKYTVAEVDVPEGYVSVVTGNASFGFTITNTHAVKTTAVGVKKIWNDGNDQDGLRPAEVTAQLLANGEVVAEAKLSAQNAWVHQWTDLPIIANGKAIEYTVAETDIPEGYTSSVMGSAADGFTLVNAHATATTSVSVHKEWKDSAGNQQSGVHPAVTAQLYRTVAGQTSAMAGYAATLDEVHGWAASWGNLPAKDAGRDVEYSVQEADVPAGYTSSVTKAADGTYSFILANTAEKRTSVSVAKVWADGGNADSMRPDSVTAQLYLVDAQGNQVAVPGKSAELSEANNWAFTWDDLAVSDTDGNEISYTVQEANVPEGYTATVSGGMVDGTYSFTLTNTHELKTVDINVSKVWNDQDDIDGLRPASVTAQLCYVNADGQTVPVEGAEDKVLDESNGWAAGWTGLTANADGKAVKYTVREAEVPEGYTSAASGIDNGDGTYSFTMVNTHEIEEAEFALSGYSVRSISAPAPEADKVCYVDPKITKEMVGRALQSGEFTFQLIDKATGAVVSQATNDALGMIDFDAANNQAAPGMEPSCLRFTNTGTFTYMVQELPGSSDPTVEYSTERIEFVVTVNEVDGALKATDMHYVCYKDKDDTVGTSIDAMGDSVVHPTITNHVKPIQLGLTKVDAADAGKTLPGAVYGLYRASDSGDALVAKATSDKDGHMTFLTGAGSAEVISEGVDYWFAEISAPQGYALSDVPTQHFHIDRVGKGAESKYQLVYADGSRGKLYDAGTVIEFGDGAKPVTDTALEMTVAKVNSARTGLAGAKLGVRLADGTDPIKEWVSTGAGQVLTGLKANTAYVLYEAEAPEGFAKAGDVTFMLDERGAVQLVDGAWGENILNSYASGSQLTLVDYTNKEIVEKKQVQREEGKTAGKLSQTGDQLPVAPLAVVAVIALAAAVIAGTAAAKRRKR